MQELDLNFYEHVMSTSEPLIVKYKDIVKDCKFLKNDDTNSKCFVYITVVPESDGFFQLIVDTNTKILRIFKDQKSIIHSLRGESRNLWLPIKENVTINIDKSYNYPSSYMYFELLNHNE